MVLSNVVSPMVTAKHQNHDVRVAAISNCSHNITTILKVFFIFTLKTLAAASFDDEQ
jgi:hypothetical protein